MVEYAGEHPYTVVEHNSSDYSKVRIYYVYAIFECIYTMYDIYECIYILCMMVWQSHYVCVYMYYV